MDENNHIPMDNGNIPNENDGGVQFDAQPQMPLVEKKPEDKKAKIPAIIAVCVLVLAIIIGCVVYFVSTGKKKPDSGDNPIGGNGSVFDENEFMSYIYESMSDGFVDENGSELSKEEYISRVQQQVQEATTTLSDHVGVTSPHSIVNKNPAQQNPDGGVNEGAQAQDTQQVNAVEAQIKAFFDRSCYLRGAVYSSNTGDSMSIAFDGDNLEVLSNLDGNEVAIMIVDGKTYIKRPATKQYIEMTDSIMELLGITADDFSFEFGSAGYEEMSKHLVSSYDVTIDDKDGVCLEYKKDSQIFRFYAADSKITQIDICAEDGTVYSQLAIDYFSESIPADQLTLKGYTESTLGAIFADLI